MADQVASVFHALIDNVESIVRGKAESIRLALCCLLTEGHLLIDDVPGTGKTSMAKAIAGSIAGSWKRVQFTPDLLPSDVTGVMVFDQRTSSFSFRQGPVFTNVLIGDEINRASPKTQSALLEVMEERQVTADGVPHLVPRPFFVIATQNPRDFHGTFPLPDVQLDRFAMKLSLGYADQATEVIVLEAYRRENRDRGVPVPHRHLLRQRARRALRPGLHRRHRRPRRVPVPLVPHRGRRGHGGGRPGGGGVLSRLRGGPA